MIVDLEVMKVNPKDLIKYVHNTFSEDFIEDVCKYWDIDVNSNKEFIFIFDKDNRRIMIDKTENGLFEYVNDNNNDDTYDFYCYSEKQSVEEFQKELNRIYKNDRIYYREIKLFEHKEDLFLYQFIEDTNYKDIIFPDIEEIKKRNLDFTVFRVDRKTKSCLMIESEYHKLVTK